MSVNTEAIRNLSDFQSSDGDCVVDDSTLPVSHAGTEQKSTVVELSASSNDSDSSDAVSDTIAMSARSVDDIVAPYISPKTSTPDTRKLRSVGGSRGSVIGSRDRSQQQTPASVSSHSIAQYFTRKPSVEKPKKLVSTADDKEEAPVARTTRSKASLEKEKEEAKETAVKEASMCKVQTEESGDKFSSPNIIEETPLEVIAKYSSKSNTPNNPVQSSEITAEEVSLANLQKIEKQPLDTVFVPTQAVQEPENREKSMENGGHGQPPEQVLTSFGVTPATEAPTTPKSARLSAKLGTPGILKKIDSPANPDKKNLRVHFVPDEAEIKKIADIDQITSPTRKSVRKISLPTQNNDNVVQNRKRPWENDANSIKDSDALVSAPLIPLLEMDRSPPEKSALNNLSANVPSSPRSPLIKKSKLKPMFSPKSSSSTVTSVPAVKEVVTPFMPELASNDEAKNQGINQLCRTLAPGGTSTLVMHLHSKKVLTVGAFASLSESDILALPIKMADKLEKVREILCKLYLGPAPVANKIKPVVTASISQAVPEIAEDILTDEKENCATVAAALVATEPLEDSMDVDIFSTVPVDVPLTNQPIKIWCDLKTSLSWADDPSVSFQQSSAIEMLMALATASKNISEKMYGEISAKTDA
uniref:Uncharacterized protein n=1 Tax=Ditylenchus dipsaci TaxID=166011 RepID=A0A915DDD8_9BILA